MSAHPHAAELAAIQTAGEDLARRLRALAAQVGGTVYTVQRGSYWFDRAASDYAASLTNHADLIESCATRAAWDAEAHTDDMETAEAVEVECAEEAEYEREQQKEAA